MNRIRIFICDEILFVSSNQEGRDVCDVPGFFLQGKTAVT